MSRFFDGVVYGAALCVILATIAMASNSEHEAKQQSKTAKVEVESKPAPQSAIHYTSQAGCAPCLAFARVVPELEAVGWLMVKRPPDPRGTPAFDVYVAGKNIATRTGYSNKNNFYRWLRQSVEANR
ncbi:hypothetical protein N8510_01365 [bacterium]|nr:hypothetical protein [bacterium]